MICHAGVRLTGLELRRLMVPESGVAAVSQHHPVCHLAFLGDHTSSSKPTLRLLSGQFQLGSASWTVFCIESRASKDVPHLTESNAPRAAHTSMLSPARISG